MHTCARLVVWISKDSHPLSNRMCSRYLVLVKAAWGSVQGKIDEGLRVPSSEAQLFFFQHDRISALQGSASPLVIFHNPMLLKITQELSFSFFSDCNCDYHHSSAAQKEDIYLQCENGGLPVAPRPLREYGQRTRGFGATRRDTGKPMYHR